MMKHYEMRDLPELMEGKTIHYVWESESSLEITFDDGSIVEISFGFNDDPFVDYRESKED